MANLQLEVIINMLRAAPIRDGADFAAGRAAINAAATVFRTPDDVTCEPVDADGVPAEWVSAPGADPKSVIYYLHGGGYTIGSITSHREMVSRISRASGARALAIDYRLAPENPFPAGIEDAVAGYRWLLAQGIDPARITIGGDSAGGGLTIATLLSLRDAGDPLPAAAFLISPWTDMEATGESMKTKASVDPMIRIDDERLAAKAYLGGADPRNPLASPIYADLSGLPPLLILVGSSEVLLDDSTRLAKNAKRDGVDATLEIWDEMIHVWTFFAAMLPEGQQAIDRIGAFIRERTRVPV